MWGTRPYRVDEQGNIRFIPTHVGNTEETAEAGRYQAVHPHACGEHMGGRGAYIDRDGSSPRMWGTQS